MIIKNQTKETVLVENGRIANTFFTRLKGLLGSKPLKEGEGLLLQSEKSIHTFFMTFPIDVIYINAEHQIIRFDLNMPPNKIGKYISKAAYILELPVGMIEKTHSDVGDQLVFIQKTINQKTSSQS